MTKEEYIEDLYQQSLEENLIIYLSQLESIPLDKAAKIYYSSKLADKISEGKYGVQYLDYRILAEILKENEPELFQ